MLNNSINALQGEVDKTEVVCESVFVFVCVCSDYSVLSCVMKQGAPSLIKGTNRITNLGNRTEPQDQMASGQKEEKEREDEREREKKRE